MLTADAMKAGIASEVTRLTPRPTGNEACNHCMSDILVMHPTVVLRKLSNVLILLLLSAESTARPKQSHASCFREATCTHTTVSN